MPRNARRQSESGIYHVMLRAVNQQQIFYDDEDRNLFLDILKEYKTISRYDVPAYCLMGNHIHLVIKVRGEDLAQIFKRVGGKFVYWYNGKYSRAGHLFQDRYKSEPIEDDAYLLRAVRYVHQNPVKALMAGSVNNYAWSSYPEYIGENKRRLADTELVLGMTGIDEFVWFHQAENNDRFIDMTEPKPRRTDEQARKIILETSRREASEFAQLDDHTRVRYIAQFKEQGLSIRQITRLTGVPKGIVERA